jgi:1-deoxy-D-xylulose-5-phosphate reductoisomerase
MSLKSAPLGKKKGLALFGSTGSIGDSTLKIASHLSSLFKIEVLATNSNIELLEKQILEFSPSLVVVFDDKKALELKKRVTKVKIVSGKEGLEEGARFQSVDTIIMAMTGKNALLPTICAIEEGKTIALATKEVLVSAGEWLTSLAKRKKASIIPVDSEHNAIFQALHKEDCSKVRRLILTASGGPFRNFPKEKMDAITVAEALGHPTWKMGKKVTIDSSTLMNKALEIIEAHYLFDMPLEKVEVIVHPQSIVHSFVEFIDGSIIAVMNEPNMAYPIQYALTYPERVSTCFPPFDFTSHQNLEFFPPDNEKFPALRLAYEVLKEGKSFPCFLNAANDVLVYRFLKGEINWTGIVSRLEKLLISHEPTVINSLETIFHIDQAAREEALKI